MEWKEDRSEKNRGEGEMKEGRTKGEERGTGSGYGGKI